MNLGILIIILAFTSIVVSTVGFLLAARGSRRFERLGRTGYQYFVFFVILASLLLFYLFLSGDYSYTYVYEYSSSDLSIFYLISGFWAGQRGTYLLWLLLLAFLGYYILRRGGEYRSYAMFFFGLVNIFFGVMLLVLSPFEKLAIPQAEGAGLNPLLKDPWMVIHPPVIFLGYAAVALPFAIALAALAKNKFDGWLRISFAPTVLATLALAAGNIMGGFWAYKTLGWGGYWAWDPVENSSFIPWITSLALIHGLLLERRGGTLRKTNIFLALFTFLLVVYGTFLTRSGVLADFSVHSFVDLGVNSYLIGFMLGFVILAMVLFALRAAKIKGPAVNLAYTSREFALLISVWVLVLIALLVLAGTSWPLITTAFGTPGTVDTAVYTRVTFPLALVIGLFLGFSPFMVRAGGPFSGLLRKVYPSGAGALIATAVALVAGVRAIPDLLFVFFVALAFFSNLVALAGYMPRRIWQAGAQVSHFGFALMLIGVLGSSAYSTSCETVIDRGASDRVFGVDITYRGTAGDIRTPDNEIVLEIADDDGTYEARPRLFWSQRMDAMMKKPHITRYPLYDLYFAPEQIQEFPGQNGIEISRGQTVELGGYSLTFTGYEQGAHEMGADVKFGAVLEVADSTGRTATVVPYLTMGTDGRLSHEDIPLVDGRDDLPVRLEKIFADRGAILVSVPGLTPTSAPDRLILEVSRKPTMNLLWAGAILLLLGGLMALRNRWRISPSTE